MQAGTSAPRLSLIVPAFNEERYLPALLDSVDLARERYGYVPGALEVIVADNASTDRTREIALTRGCRVVSVEKRVIAAARNLGAHSALGPVLCFVDADTRVHPDTFRAVEQALASGRFVGGATGVTMERWSPGIAATYGLMLPVVWTTSMDTGVVFCRREDFEAVGGYDESKRIAEDVDFLWRLRRLGRSRRQRLGRLREVKAVASSRKFDEHGDWHAFRLFPRLVPDLLLRRARFDEQVERYWYRPKR